MKKIFKLVAVLTALTVAGFGFVACSDDENTAGDLRKTISGTVVATYVRSFTAEVDDGVEGVITQTVTFYTADSEKLFQLDEKEEAGGQEAYYTFCEGTYDGTPTTDGNVTLSVKKSYKPNSDLTALNQKTENYSLTATISGTKATITNEDGDKIGEFTRQ